MFLAFHLRILPSETGREYQDPVGAVSALQGLPLNGRRLASLTPQTVLTQTKVMREMMSAMPRAAGPEMMTQYPLALKPKEPDSDAENEFPCILLSSDNEEDEDSIVFLGRDC